MIKRVVKVKFVFKLILMLLKKDGCNRTLKS